MKKLLVVVDYQNDFVNGSLGFDGAEKIEEPIARKINEYRKTGGDVAFTIDTHSNDYLNTAEGKALPIIHCLKNSSGWELYGKTAQLKQVEDHCFYKHSYGSAELFKYLRFSNYDKVELVGVVTNICVLVNAVLAKTALPEAEIVVDSSCVAGNDDRLCRAALEVMQGLQIKIV